MAQRYRTTARKIWEAHYGKIPKGYDIHHIDFNWQNDDITNMLCCTRKEHAEIHKRQYELTGDYRQALAHNVLTDGNYITGWKQPLIVKDKIRVKSVGRKQSKETIAKKALKTIGQTRSELFKRNQRNAKLGKKRKPFSTEWKDNLKLAWEIVNPYITCPHCKIYGRGPNMKRYHGDNCKHKNLHL